MRIFYKPSPDERAADFNSLISENFPHFLTEENPELVLVAGGDGALHHATKDFPYFDGIFFGKAKGTLNFLMNSFESDIEILKGIEANTIKVAVIGSATFLVSINNERSCVAVNDIIFGDSINGYHTFTLNTDDGSFTNFVTKGTGLCISTPLGSTAYNFNNGGAILPLESNLLSLTGIVCNKYINDILVAQPLRISTTGGSVTVDGIHLGKLSASDIVTITPHSKIKLGFLDKKEFLNRRIELGDRLRKGRI